MDDDSDVFIGEDAPADDASNPLALSSRDGTPTSSSGESDGEDVVGIGRAQTLEEASEYLAQTDRILAAFTAAADNAHGHPYLPCATPALAGQYRVAGLSRLRGKIVAEQKQIRDSIARETFGRVSGSNVAGLAIAVTLLATEPDVSSALCHVATRATGRHESVEVDLITDGGQRWVKVKASSPANFLREVGIAECDPDDDDDDEGGSASGDSAAAARPPAAAPFLDTLRILLRAADDAQFRLPFGRRPHIVVACAHEPPSSVRHVIRNLSPRIELRAVRATAPGRPLADALDPRDNCCLRERVKALPSGIGYAVRWVNFDVTAMVALVCDCCHGFAGTNFPNHQILRQQSQDEAGGNRAVVGHIEPAIMRHTRWGPPPANEQCAVADGELCALDDPKADAAVEKAAPWMAAWPLNWVASEVAIAEFRWILDTIAGADELRRSRWLLRRVQARPADIMSPAVESLKATKRIHPRHRAVFGLGDAIDAVTVSGNRTFVQAAQEQGVALLVCFHPSRALTERKRLGIDVAPKSQPPALPSEAAAPADEQDA